jgi:hypothetical protein
MRKPRRIVRWGRAAVVELGGVLLCLGLLNATATRDPSVAAPARTEQPLQIDWSEVLLPFGLARGEAQPKRDVEAPDHDSCLPTCCWLRCLPAFRP